MQARRSVVCPVDFSAQSRLALVWASAIARHRDVPLTVLFVVEPLLAQVASLRLGVDLVRADALPELRAFVGTAVPDATANVTTEVVAGAPADAILAAARRHDAALIVMGTHGLGGFRKVFLGSTTEQVLRRTEWPVLAVPPEATNAPVIADGRLHLRSILLATDFGESARAATRWAAHLASDVTASLVLAHVVEPVTVPPWWQSLAADIEGDRAESGRRMLEHVAAGLDDVPSVGVVSPGRAADVLASLAAEHEVDLVVMGLTNAEDWAMRRPGSIAYHVLRSAHVAVVVVPAGADGPPARLGDAAGREAVDAMAADAVSQR